MGLGTILVVYGQSLKAAITGRPGSGYKVSESLDRRGQAEGQQKKIHTSLVRQSRQNPYITVSLQDPQVCGWLNTFCLTTLELVVLPY